MYRSCVYEKVMSLEGQDDEIRLEMATLYNAHGFSPTN
jgi:hypothetical protein